MTNNPNTNTKCLVPLMNKEDSGKRKGRTVTRLFSAIVLNLLPKVTFQEINMMFHGYLIWSLNHNITKDTYPRGSISFLLVQSVKLKKKEDSQLHLEGRNVTKGQKQISSDLLVVSWEESMLPREADRQKKT